MKASQLLTLTFDDSKAIDDQEIMSVEICYIGSDGLAVTQFLKLEAVDQVDAENLTESLVRAKAQVSAKHQCDWSGL